MLIRKKMRSFLDYIRFKYIPCDVLVKEVWNIISLFHYQGKNIPQNQHFPANAERMVVCTASSWDVFRNTSPSALEISLGQSVGPRAAKSLPSGNGFPNPSFQQFIDTILFHYHWR